MYSLPTEPNLLYIIDKGRNFPLLAPIFEMNPRILQLEALWHVSPTKECIVNDQHFEDRAQEPKTVTQIQTMHRAKFNLRRVEQFEKDQGTLN